MNLKSRDMCPTFRSTVELRFFILFRSSCLTFNSLFILIMHRRNCTGYPPRIPEDMSEITVLGRINLSMSQHFDNDSSAAVANT